MSSNLLWSPQIVRAMPGHALLMYKAPETDHSASIVNWIICPRMKIRCEFSASWKHAHTWTHKYARERTRTHADTRACTHTRARIYTHARTCIHTRGHACAISMLSDLRPESHPREFLFSLSRRGRVRRRRKVASASRARSAPPASRAEERS